MTPRPESYRRLPGRSFGFICSDTVWISDDHVLAVRASADGDAYRRFFFCDIEAIVTRRTSARLWNNVILVVATIAGLLLWSMLSVQGLIGLSGLVSLAPLILVLINTARGPTCEVRIQTAVQSERVAALGRERTARATIALLRPLIWQAQQAETAAATTTTTTTPDAPGATPVPPS